MKTTVTASQIDTTFCAFIAKEREHYEGHDNNKVATSLSQVSRYLRFVDIVHSRFLEVNESCVQANRRLNEGMIQSGTQELTADKIDQLHQVKELFQLLHLEIECFFIFTAIALDKIAHFVEDYFGYAHRGPSLKSHHKWCKSATEFEGIKDIHLPDQMLFTMERLQRQVVNYRDKQITHQRNSRTSLPTLMAADGAAKIAISHLYPCDSDTQEESPHIADVLTNLEAYVKQLMDLIVTNRTKSRYNVLSC